MFNDTVCKNIIVSKRKIAKYARRSAAAKKRGGNMERVGMQGLDQFLFGTDGMFPSTQTSRPDV